MYISDRIIQGYTDFKSLFHLILKKNSLVYALNKYQEYAPMFFHTPPTSFLRFAQVVYKVIYGDCF